MILVTFAVPHESRRFIPAPGVERDRVLVMHTGIGLAAAEEAVRAQFARQLPSVVIAAGFAGGLDPRLEVGDAVIGTNACDESWLPRCRALWENDSRVFFGPLATVTKVAGTVAEKAALARETGACAVDMETSAIATVCREANVPLLPLRVISDGADAALPVPFDVAYDLARQRPRPVAVAVHLLRHPGSIVPLTRFLRDLAKAQGELGRRLVELLGASV